MATEATTLAQRRAPFPGESKAYQKARTALLAREIELQRMIDGVAKERRKLPQGPLIEEDYRFLDMNGSEVGLADLFGQHDTLIAYNWMYGPERERPCPMCTNLLGPLDQNAADLMQRVGLAIIGRSPIERQIAFAQERGWRHLPFVKTVGDAFPIHFGAYDPEEGYEYPVMIVLTKSSSKKDADVRLFWKGEMTREMADKGTDPRGGPDIGPVWTLLDLTPEGRGKDWYPKLSY